MKKSAASIDFTRSARSWKSLNVNMQDRRFRPNTSEPGEKPGLAFHCAFGDLVGARIDQRSATNPTRPDTNEPIRMASRGSAKPSPLASDAMNKLIVKPIPQMIATL